METITGVPARRASMLAVLTAAAISSNYLLIGVVNVKFMDLIVFASGYLFGAGFGVAVGTLTWLVYGTLNPYGFMLPILVATILGESIYGVAGGLASRVMRVGEGRGADIRFGVVGFLLTVVYDLFTNIVSALVIGLPISVGLVTGLPFTAIHTFSNTIFFTFGMPPLANAIQRLIGEDLDE